MLSIKRSSVPSYLHDSAFYLSLNADDDGELSIPVASFKPDDQVTDEYFLKNGHKCGEQTMRIVVENGHLHCLQYLHAIGRPRTEQVISTAYSLYTHTAAGG